MNRRDLIRTAPAAAAAGLAATLWPSPAGAQPDVGRVRRRAFRRGHRAGTAQAHDAERAFLRLMIGRLRYNATIEDPATRDQHLRWQCEQMDVRVRELGYG
jgi:hypothetical protein